MKYEGPNSYQSKNMANVKAFVDRQMDKQTGQKLYENNGNNMDGQTDMPKTV